MRRRRRAERAGTRGLGLIPGRESRVGWAISENLRRGLVLSDGDLLPFFSRPISAVLAVLVLWTFITNVPIIHAAVLRWRDAVMARVLPAFRRSS